MWRYLISWMQIIIIKRIFNLCFFIAMHKGFIFHPWQHIAEELAERGRSQKFFASLIQKTPQEVNHIVTWKRNINADWAFRLSAVFWTSAQVWMNLQAKYDLAILEEKEEERKLWKSIRLNVKKQLAIA